ncbi:MAG TPA: DUF4126 family protein [Mycobacterium sp.]|jgi:uncharacterized membrane protein
MTTAALLGLSLLIGVVAGSRALTAPAVMSWAAVLHWIPVDDKWSFWMGSWIAVGIFTALALVELVTDQLPKTPNRKTAPQFSARLLTGAFAGAVLGSGWHHTFAALGAGVVGAVFGTLGFYEFRHRLVAATGGRDLPIALLEDAIAVGGGFLVAYLASL